MKANELMIGDYARVNRDGLCIKKGSVVVIRGIDADDKLEGKGLVGVAHCHPLDEEQFDGGIWCEYLEPIPLTAEILEKNGFETEDAKEGGFVICDDYYDIFIYEWSDSIWVARYESTEMYIPFEQATMSYVHELQHFLRTSGIEKEIEL